MKRLYFSIIILLLTFSFTYSQKNYTKPPIIIDSFEKTDISCRGANDGVIAIFSKSLENPEYSLDGLDFSEKNKFSNLGPGEYTPFVRGSSEIESSIKVLFEFDVTIYLSDNDNAIDGTLLITEKIPSESDENPDANFDIALITTQGPSNKSNDGIHFATNTSLINVFAPDVNALNNAIPFESSGLNFENSEITLLPDGVPNPYNIFSLSDKSNTNTIFEIVSGKIELFDYTEDYIEVGYFNFIGRPSGSKIESEFSGEFFGYRKKAYTKIPESIFVAKGENITILEPDSLIINTEIKGSCGNQNNGEVTVSASGGTGSYQYSILLYGSNSVHVFSESNSFNGLEPGYYFVAVRDSNMCTEYGEFFIEDLDLQYPPTLEILTNQVPSNEVYLSSNYQGFNIWLRNGVEISGENEPYIRITDGGNYQVKVISDAGCESFSNVLDLNWYPIKIQDPVIENPTCFGLKDGTVLFSATGGEGPLQFSLNGVYFVSDSTFRNLAPGDYTVHVRGAERLNYVESRTFTVSEPLPLQLTISEERGPNCPGENSGRIRAVASGGTGPYTYWISGRQQSNAEGVFDGLPDGEFTVTVRDRFGCEAIRQTNLYVEDDYPPIPTIRLNTAGAPSNIVSLVSSSTSGNSWLRNDVEIEGENGQNLIITEGGEYLLKVSSAFGCESFSDVLNIDWYPINILTPIVESPTCFGLENGKLQISATVGEGTLSYSLDGLNYRSGSSFDNLPAGEYTFYIRGSQNLNYVENRSFTVSEPEPLALVILEEKGPNCLGENSGIIRASATGGTGPYSFEVSNQQQSNNNGIFQGLPEGVFLLTARDQNGCEVVREVSLETIGQFPPIPEISFREPDGTPSGVGLVSSSTLNNQWVRDDIDIPGATEQIFPIDQAGVYRVRVTSEEGCSSISDPIVLTSLEENRPIRISMYPNPAEQYVKIDFQKPTEILMLHIFDIKGLLVKAIEQNLFVDDYLEIDLNGLESGIYFIHLKNKEFYQVLKLHKQ